MTRSLAKLISPLAACAFVMVAGVAGCGDSNGTTTPTASDSDSDSETETDASTGTSTSGTETSAGVTTVGVTSDASTSAGTTAVTTDDTTGSDTTGFCEGFLPEPLPETLDAAMAGVAYEVQFTMDGVDPADALWSNDGELPAGLSLDPDTGVLSGVPELPGEYMFGITGELKDPPQDCAIVPGYRDYALKIAG